MAVANYALRGSGGTRGHVLKRVTQPVVQAAGRVTLGLLLGLGLAACSGHSGGTADGVHLVNAGKLTVCTHLPYKPFEFTDTDGKVVGFDVDMTGLLAKKLGVTEKVISVDWNQVLSGAVFTAGKCDLAMGGETITPERAKAVRFSEPYFNATQALLVRKGAGISGLADLKGRKVGVQTDTTGEAYAKKHATQDGYTVVIFDDIALETAAVSAGQVAAAIGDNGALYQYVKDNPKTAVATEFNTGEEYGFAAKKSGANAKKLIDKLNAAITQAKQNGEYDRIFQKWFGQVPGQINK